MPGFAVDDTINIGVGSLSFGIRVDAAWGFLDILEAGHAGMPPPLTALAPRAYPHETYQPFPENWDGETGVP